MGAVQAWAGALALLFAPSLIALWLLLRPRKVTVLEVHLDRRQAVQEALEELGNQGVQAVWAWPDGTFTPQGRN